MTRHAPFLVVLVCVVTLAAGIAYPDPAGAVGRFLDAVGADAGGEPRVKVYGAFEFGWEVAELLAFDAAFRGGVRVAVGDIDGDGLDDLVVAAGPGGGPHVKVFRGTCSFPPYNGLCHSGPPFFIPGTFGVDTVNPLASFYAFDPAFRGGVFVAVENFDQSNDATSCVRNEIVVSADAGGGPHVKIFRNATVGGDCPVATPVVIDPDAPIASFYAFAPEFTGGVRVAAADLNGDGFADLVVGAGPGGGPHVKVFPNLSTSPAGFGGLDTDNPVASFYAFAEAFGGGVYVGTVSFFDIRGLGPPILPLGPDLVIGAGSGGGPHVVVIRNTTFGATIDFDLTTPVASFYAFDSAFSGGVRVGSAAFPFILHAVPGPGGPGVVKVFVNVDGVATEATLGVTPFDLSTLGGFPSQ